MGILFFINCVSSSTSIHSNNTPPKIERTLILIGVNFDINSAELDSSDCSVLDKLYNSLEFYSTLKVFIIGHTDGMGNKDFNIKLSQKRAESVRLYLITKGISENRIIAIGAGDSYHICPINPRKNERIPPNIKNERIEVVPESIWESYKKSAKISNL